MKRFHMPSISTGTHLEHIGHCNAVYPRSNHIFLFFVFFCFDSAANFSFRSGISVINISWWMTNGARNGGATERRRQQKSQTSNGDPPNSALPLIDSIKGILSMRNNDAVFFTYIYICLFLCIWLFHSKERIFLGPVEWESAVSPSISQQRW